MKLWFMIWLATAISAFFWTRPTDIAGCLVVCASFCMWVLSFCAMIIEGGKEAT